MLIDCIILISEFLSFGDIILRIMPLSKTFRDIVNSQKLLEINVPDYLAGIELEDLISLLKRKYEGTLRIQKAKYFINLPVRSRDFIMVKSKKEIVAMSNVLFDGEVVSFIAKYHTRVYLFMFNIENRLFSTIEILAPFRQFIIHKCHGCRDKLKPIDVPFIYSVGSNRIFRIDLNNTSKFYQIPKSRNSTFDILNDSIFIVKRVSKGGVEIGSVCKLFSGTHIKKQVNNFSDDNFRDISITTFGINQLTNDCFPREHLQ